MKLFIILLSFMILTYVSTAQRLYRDVSVPQNQYLSPHAGVDILAAKSLTEVPTEEINQQNTTVFGKNGYEYKTVRRLLRDVSHLKLQHYLPPTNEYLPPVNAEVPAELSQVSNKYLPPINVKETEISTEQPKALNDILPVEAKELEISTKQTKFPNEYLAPIGVKVLENSSKTLQLSNDYLPPAKLEEISVTEAKPSTKTSAAIEQETEIPEIITLEDSSTEVPEIEGELPLDTAILLDDGYHYKKPLEIPNLFPQTLSPSKEFLPPLDDDVIEVVGPKDGESEVLADDGYHYRAIKRRF